MWSATHEAIPASEALRVLVKDKAPHFSSDADAQLDAYKKSLYNPTKFIPS